MPFGRTTGPQNLLTAPRRSTIISDAPRERIDRCQVDRADGRILETFRNEVKIPKRHKRKVGAHGKKETRRTAGVYEADCGHQRSTGGRRSSHHQRKAPMSRRQLKPVFANSSACRRGRDRAGPSAREAPSSQKQMEDTFAYCTNWPPTPGCAGSSSERQGSHVAERLEDGVRLFHKLPPRPGSRYGPL